MSTFLFDKIVFGPVKSRRLGVSLGINILYTNKKFCNYNCVYCECGWTQLNNDTSNLNLPTPEVFSKELEQQLQIMKNTSQKPDVITFAGNGEPTLHPDFLTIINETIRLKNIYFPDIKIAVLTNATNLHNPDVVEGLNKIDMPILKIDTLNQHDFELINGANKNIRIDKIVDNIILKIKRPIIQTMFFKANFGNYKFNNTSEKFIVEYLEVLNKIMPEKVMIYSIARDTPMNGLGNVELYELEKIGERIKSLGFDTLVTP